MEPGPSSRPARAEPIGPERRRLLLLAPARSYRTADFLAAARRMELSVIVACEEALPLNDCGACVQVPFEPVGEGVSRLLELTTGRRPDAVVAVDDGCLPLAAATASAMGLRHNDPQAVAIAGDKHRFRATLAGAGLPVPGFRLLEPGGDLEAAAREVSYPCVLKPVSLSGSRGVIRADDVPAFVAAAARILQILDTEPAVTAGGRRLLVEDFIPGMEVCLDGLLAAGELTVLAVFDKPDACAGPFFEETLLVTPPALDAHRERALVEQVRAAAAAMGLRDGPIHAEARINDDGVWLLEMAARSIGGHCSRALVFTPDLALEELILRSALALPGGNYALDGAASGVMMIPIPAPGRLDSVDGLTEARAVPGVTDVQVTIPVGDTLVPLPEGDRYLGFIFARGDSRERVVAALHDAHRCLRFAIAGSVTCSAPATRRPTPPPAEP